MRHIKSAARIARQIRETEAAMDKTILRANALVTAMIEARIEGNLAAEVGQDALNNVVHGIKCMSMGLLGGEALGEGAGEARHHAVIPREAGTRFVAAVPAGERHDA